MKKSHVELEPAWKVFVVTHKFVVDEYFDADPNYHPSFYPIINVSTRKLDINPRYLVLNQNELPTFRALGPHWAESEAIWNIWRAGLHKKLKFIGFTQYDKDLVHKSKYLNKKIWITSRIDQFVQVHERGHISLQRHLFARDFLQFILADYNQPSTLTGSGHLAYTKIINDYNNYFKKNVSYLSLFSKFFITLCSSFVVDTATFDKMMRFFDFIIRDSDLDSLDPQRLYRLQGGLSERYFGVFLSLEKIKNLNLTTGHSKLI